MNQNEQFGMQMVPVSLKNSKQAVTNYLYTSQNCYDEFKAYSVNKSELNIMLNKYVYRLMPEKDFKDNQIAINNIVRQFLSIPLTNQVYINLFSVPQSVEKRLATVNIEIESFKPLENKMKIEDDVFNKQFIEMFKGQFFKQNQKVLFLFQGVHVLAHITEINIMLFAKSDNQMSLDTGVLIEDTQIQLSLKSTSNFKLNSTGNVAKQTFDSNFSLGSLDIGGLDQELSKIFRRVFQTRRFPPNLLKKYGKSHVKGLLLYGPPGCGKTLIARQLGKALKSVEPKKVNGPEIMSKYVGQAEENIRNLFKDAIAEEAEAGEDSQLHIIIFDEIDAICKQRGTNASSSGAYDSVVNQLLTMIDGIDSLNNILVIGMTNRRDMLDEALLRPGRFDIQIEIKLPDERGRRQILDIHTKQMYINKVISNEVDLDYFAKMAKNFTGAEIEDLVKNARQWAFERIEGIKDFSKEIKNVEVVINKKDFEASLSEMKPQFGVDTDTFDKYLRGEVVDYGSRYQDIQTSLKAAIDQTVNSKNSQLHSILLEGEIGSGKTSLACKTAKDSGFPYLKIVSAEQFLGYSELHKLNAISKIFEDAYKSPLSCIVIDEIERVIEFSSMGARYSNGILQAILVLLKKIPIIPTHRILIIGTTHSLYTLNELEIKNSFKLTINIPKLLRAEYKYFLKYVQFNNESEQNQIINTLEDGLAVKNLLTILDMSYSGEQFDVQKFKQQIQNIQN